MARRLAWDLQGRKRCTGPLRFPYCFAGADRDRDALGLLFRRHNVRVYRFVLRIVGDAAEAEDLMTDVFFDVWRQAAQFEAVEGLHDDAARAPRLDARRTQSATGSTISGTRSARGFVGLLDGLQQQFDQSPSLLF
jgi:sigma-70-like protein